MCDFKHPPHLSNNRPLLLNHFVISFGNETLSLFRRTPTLVVVTCLLSDSLGLFLRMIGISWYILSLFFFYDRVYRHCFKISLWLFIFMQGELWGFFQESIHIKTRRRLYDRCFTYVAISAVRSLDCLSLVFTATFAKLCEHLIQSTAFWQSLINLILSQILFLVKIMLSWKAFLKAIFIEWGYYHRIFRKISFEIWTLLVD